MFEMAAHVEDPIDLSIGQPDFDVPEPARAACAEAIENRKNGYSVTQGIAPLREKLQAAVDAELGHADRRVFVSSGTSGGLTLALMSLVDPGDEVIVFDPFFVMYEALVHLVGGVPVLVDTYPDFRIDAAKVAEAITPRTKLILLNSPANPTGACAGRDEVRALAELAAARDVALLSDEVYRRFCYDRPFVSPASFNDRTIVVDGFSKAHAMTGWRLGFVHGPAEVIETMLKVQQYTFVCAPQPVQWGGLAALDVDTGGLIDAYRTKRDRLVDGLGATYELETPGGAFYMFPKVPNGTATQFVRRAIDEQLLIIPGNIFSRRDTHFRISYAADDRTIDRGIEALRKLAGK